MYWTFNNAFMPSQTSEPSDQALTGLLVLDLTRVLAGPWATQNLADLGASIIKIERPGAGDDTRSWGPPFFTADDGSRTDATYYLSANRGKQSVTVDISLPEGAALIRALALKADVLVENYKLGGLAQYGLDYASLSTLNPRLVYCSITGFGQTGPYSPRAGYDFLAQGMAGLMSVTGERDDLPGGGPQKAGIPISDLATGLYAVSAILAAVHQRHRTGRGQHIDLSLLDVGVALMSSQAMHYFATGEAPRRAGNGHNSIVPYQSFQSADGHVIIAAANDAQFYKLARELGHPEWEGDERFRSNAARVQHRGVLIPLIEGATRKRSTAALVSALETRSVPCGYINDMAQAFDDPHIIERSLRRTVGPLKTPTVASPFRMSDSAVRYDMAPPALGQHTDQVLTNVLGLTPQSLRDLRLAGAI